MRRPGRVVVVWGLLAVSCTGGGSGPAASVPIPSHVPGVPVSYVAVGASETAGVGTFDPLRNAWPRILWRQTLPAGSTLFDLGVPGSLASQALADQVPEAVAVHPDVATVWLNVNDLVHGVSAPSFGRTLGEIVHRLRDGGRTTVLVANVPHVEVLPIYLACISPTGVVAAPLGNVVHCPAELIGTVPPPAEVRAAIDAYNRVTARVVRTEGAVLVDLHGLGPLPTERPETIAEDGFHPSNAGAEVVANLFGRAWTDARSDAA